MSWKTFRSERGQTASEYMGILLLVAVIIGTLVQSGVAGKIANGATDMVQAIAGGGKHNGGGGNPGGGSTQGGGNTPGGRSDDEKKTLLCLNSSTDLSACLTAA